MRTLGGMELQKSEDSTLSPVQERVEERLARQRKQLMDEVEAIDKALEALNRQPELLETLNVLRRVGV